MAIVDAGGPNYVTAHNPMPASRKLEPMHRIPDNDEPSHPACCRVEPHLIYKLIFFPHGHAFACVQCLLASPSASAARRVHTDRRREKSSAAQRLDSAPLSVAVGLEFAAIGRWPRCAPRLPAPDDDRGCVAGAHAAWNCYGMPQVFDVIPDLVSIPSMALRLVVSPDLGLALGGVILSQKVTSSCNLSMVQARGQHTVPG